MSLLSVGATLLGGLLGRSRSRYVVPNYAQIRARAEAAGFNPLTALGSAPGSVVLDDNAAMGSAIANAGLMAAEGLKANSAAAKLSQAQMETRKLKQQLERATLRPKTPGVYAGNMAVPEAASALGVGGANASGSGGGGGSVSADSPFASPASGRDDGSRTAVQVAVAKDVPALRAFGHDWYGSGAFSSGQQIEDGIGEGPMQWAWGPLVVGDAVLNEAYKFGGYIGGSYAAARERAAGNPVFTIGGERYALAGSDAYLRAYREKAAATAAGYARRARVSAVRRGDPAPVRADGTPRFQLGKGVSLGRPRKYPFGPYLE